MALEEIDWLSLTLGEHGIVLLSHLRTELLHMGFIMVVFDDIEIQADIFFRRMNGKYRLAVRLCGKCPFPFIIFQHDNSIELLWHLLYRELCSPLLLTLLAWALDNLYLFATLSLLDHPDGAIDVAHDLLRILRILLHPFNDSRKIFHGFRAQLGGHTEVKHLNR